MTSIQSLLIGGLVVAAVVASAAFRAKLAYRGLAILMAGAAILFVAFPDATTWIARHMGVGRGADLVLYLSLVAGLHIALLLYLKIRGLERKITDQVRAMALRDAERLTEASLVKSSPIES